MGFTVAIDGPAAAGKGTIAAALAQNFGFARLDTGLLYRAVGKQMLQAGSTGNAVDIAQGLKAADLLGDDLRSPAIAQAASQIATDPQLRAALVAFQRDFARRDGGAILDGRDIGTVICPQAEVKLFITASIDRRARRRFEELCKTGVDTSLAQVRADIVARDKRDRARDSAPLIAADDAVILDTTTLSVQDVVARADKIVRHKLANRE